SLRFFGGRGPREIGELMDKREGSIRALQFRAIETLRRHLAQTGLLDDTPRPASGIEASSPTTSAAGAARGAPAARSSKGHAVDALFPPPTPRQNHRVSRR